MRGYKIIQIIAQRRDFANTAVRSLGVISDKIFHEAIESGNISLTDLTPKIRDLRNQQEKLLAKQAEMEALLSDRKIELADTRTVKEYVNELREILSEGELCERKAFIRSFVKEIIVMNNEVQLIYDISLSQEGLTEEKVGVLPIVHNGGR